MAKEAALAVRKKEGKALAPRIKREQMIRPEGGKNLQRWGVVGGCTVAAFTMGASAPIVAASAALIALLYMANEVQTAQPREEFETLRDMYESKIPGKICSIDEYSRVFRKQYPADAYNSVIEYMMDYCLWVTFKPTSTHPLAGYGELFVFKDPVTGELLMPQKAVHKLMQRRGIKPAFWIEDETIEDIYGDSNPDDAGQIDQLISDAEQQGFTDEDGDGFPDTPEFGAASEEVFPEPSDTHVATPEVAKEDLDRLRNLMGAPVPYEALEALDEEREAVEEGDQPFNLPADLANLPQDDRKSILLIGEGGSGKGSFIREWKDRILESNPDAQLFAINPKPDVKELHRWQGFKQVAPVYGKEDADKAFENLKRFEKVMEARLSQPETFLLAMVIDEYNTLFDYWSQSQKDEAARITKRISKQGRSLGVLLVLGLHSPNAEELGKMTASDRANFVAVALGYKNRQDVLTLAIRNAQLFLKLPTDTESKAESYRGKPVGIAVSSYHRKLFVLPDLSTPGDNQCIPQEQPKAIEEDVWADEPEPEQPSNVVQFPSQASVDEEEEIDDRPLLERLANPLVVGVQAVRRQMVYEDIEENNQKWAAEYSQRVREWRTYSDVSASIGNQLLHAGLISERRAKAVQEWVEKNNLPAPGSVQENVEAV